jgi:hypothetical protein
MALNWTEGVFRNSQHTGTDLLLVLILADSADRDTGACYPSVKTIARLMRSSERNVQLRLKALRDSGEITVRYQKSPYGTNLYVLNRSLLGGEVEFTPYAQETQGVKPTSSPKGTTQAQQGVKRTSPKPSVNEKEEKKVTQRKEEKGVLQETEKKKILKEKKLTDFAEWYDLYPRKVNKQRAISAWSALTNTERQLALEALPKHLTFYADKEPEYIPHPASWLNGKRWEDELPAQPKPNGRRALTTTYAENY